MTNVINLLLYKRVYNFLSEQKEFWTRRKNPLTVDLVYKRIAVLEKARAKYRQGDPVLLVAIIEVSLKAAREEKVLNFRGTDAERELLVIHKHKTLNDSKYLTNLLMEIREEFKVRFAATQ